MKTVITAETAGFADVSVPNGNCIALEKHLESVTKKQRRTYWCLKRFLDLFFSILATIVLLPLMLIVALVIVIDDPHASPIYSQERVGQHGKRFRFYKFRSMIANADKLVDSLQHQNEKDGPVFKIKNDPRITKIGRFIRKTSIDELPQLFNIIRGDMSIVGPRPGLPREVAQYNEYQKLRLMVTPGLTCYWQCQPDRDSISFDEWVDLDIQYIEDRSLAVDVKMVLKTIKSCLTGQGE